MSVNYLSRFVADVLTDSRYLSVIYRKAVVFKYLVRGNYICVCEYFHFDLLYKSE